MGMFDPYYVTSVLEDILSRETGINWKFELTPAKEGEAPQDDNAKPA